MSVSTRRRALLGILLALTAPFGDPRLVGADTAGPRLRELGSVTELQAAFDTATGTARLILLVSPT